jgi:branched-chain amino acid transport system ATP-binding protein
VFGCDITSNAPHIIASTGVARTYQNVRLFEGLSILENIMAGLYLNRTSNLLAVLLATGQDRRERRDAEARALALMARVGVDEDPARPADTLSYGVQRRVEIARALATQPKLLLLDEPTAGMNAVESAALGKLLQDLRAEGLTLFVIEHNMQLILHCCDLAVVMNFGELLAQGPPRECIERAEVREAYFGRKADADRIEHLLKLRRD